MATPKKPTPNVLKLSGQQLTLRDMVEGYAGLDRAELRANGEGTLEAQVGYRIGVSREMLMKWYRATDIQVSSLHKIVSGLQGGQLKLLVQFPEDGDEWHELTQFGPPAPKRGRPRSKKPKGKGP